MAAETTRNPEEVTLTRRDAAASTPLGALDLENPPAFLNPPTLPAPSLAWGSW